ncbi:hypothetical protein BJX70DRAFT_74500 [Aspergillus crustosus]
MLSMLRCCAVLVLGMFMFPILAQECTGLFEIHGKLDIEQILENCTVVDGSLSILPDFSGPLILAGIVNITGGIVVTAESNVTSVEAVNLVSVGELELESDAAQTVSHVSFPRLETVQGMISMGGMRDMSAKFPSLQSAGSIRLEGTLASLNLDALEVVDGGLTIHHEEDPPLDTLQLSFPVLESAQYIELSGFIEGATFPSLNTDFTSITLNTSLPMDCTVFTSQFTNKTTLSTSQQITCISPSSSSSLRANALQNESKSHHKRQTHRKKGKPSTALIALVPVSIFVVFAIGGYRYFGGREDSETRGLRDARSPAPAPAAVGGAGRGGTRSGGGRAVTTTGGRTNSNRDIRGSGSGTGSGSRSAGVAVPLPVYPGRGHGEYARDEEALGPPPRYSFTDYR